MKCYIRPGGALKTNHGRRRKVTKLQHKPQPALVLGTTVEGNKVVTLTGIDFERHKHIIGISGSGKSSFLASCALLLLKQGVPFTLIDPHGDLCKLILSLLVSR